MANDLVLVTGAAGGQQGKTGRHLSEMLLARGVPVRAFVHRIDERSDRLRALGIGAFHRLAARQGSNGSKPNTRS